MALCVPIHSWLKACPAPSDAPSPAVLPALLSGCHALVLCLLLGLPAVALAESAPESGRDIFYGEPGQAEPELQTLDIYVPDKTKLRPVVLYVHGGGWVFGDKSEVLAKPAYFNSQDLAFVSMNYRLRWDYTLFDQLEDVVGAIKWIRDNGPAQGLDPSRIILMGNGAGAHLVSLVATDPVYLAAADMVPKDIRAVVSIDNFSFDIPRVMSELGSFLQRRQHELIFGTTDSVWQAASPISHLQQGRAVPGFVLMYPTSSVETQLQTQGFARQLVKTGNTPILIPAVPAGSRPIDAELGVAGDVATQALMTFLRALL